MKRPTFRLSLKHFVLASACALGFVAFGHFAANELIEAQRVRQLRELNETALRRAELVADYGQASLDEIAKRITGDCNSSALQVLRLQVYQRSSLKDVRIINRDGTVQCSAFSETLEFDQGWIRRSDMLSASDGGALLFRVDQFGGIALGIAKDFGERISLAAIVGLNASIFDLLPRDLRDSSAVMLRLNNGLVLAGDRQGIGERMFSDPTGPAIAEKQFSDPVILTQDSRRYPFRVEMKVEAAALGKWNSEPYWPIVGLATVLGLAFGALLAGAVFRPVSPIAALDQALATGAFKPYFLPTFNLHSGRIIGCEVLARWIKPDGTVVPPLSFIPLAESSGRIDKLTWCIFEQALEQLHAILTDDRSFVVSINIMPGHMISDGFVERLRSLVVAQRVSPRQIALEVTERHAFPDLDKAATVVAELRDRGFSVALDDVGIGHNGLSQIQALGANVLKIDKFFVDSICRGTTAHVTIDMLVRLARELNMIVLAEGIETDAQRLALIECGVAEGQGYLVSPPLPAARFRAFLIDRTQSPAWPDDVRAVAAAQVA